MKKLLVALTLGLSLSVMAQNKPQGDVRATKIETTGNQMNQSTTQSPPIVSPLSPVRNENPVRENRGTSQNSTYRDYDYRNNVDAVYGGNYIPPTRNEMRYRRGQQCFTEFELNTRPFSLANGFWNAGLELSTGCKSSFLFDIASGTNALLGIQTTSGLVGFRLYSKTDMVGRYVSGRARFRSYENGEYYGGNFSLMVGYKANWDGVTLAGEFGLGYQGVDGDYLSLPTWAITLGYKL